MNCGYKILIVYAVFVSGIMFLVFKSFSQKMDLVTTDYYAKELKYQQKIDETNRVNTLSAPLICEIKDDELIIVFPKDFSGKNISGEFGKRYPYGGDRAGLDDREKSPAIQKTHQRAECLFQIDILPSGPGIHTAELAIADGRDKGKYPGEDPNEDEPAGRSDAAGDICADDEDAGADHAADDDHGGIEQAKRSFERSFFGHQAKVFPGWIDR